MKVIFSNNPYVEKSDEEINNTHEMEQPEVNATIETDKIKRERKR